MFFSFDGNFSTTQVYVHSNDSHEQDTMITGSSADDEQPVSLLESLGFREYEARCLVALLGLGAATAAELSDEADVPRPRVYDVADELADWNLIEVADGEPRRYRALPAETVIEQIESTFRERIDALSEVLADLETSGTDDQEPGVWQLEGREAILGRLQAFVAEAESELALYVTDDLLTDDYVETLEAADARGVDLHFVTQSERMRSWLDSQFPDACVADGPDIWTRGSGEASVAHLAFVDWDAAMMVSVIQPTPAAPAEYHGTLIEGVECGFIITLRNVLRSALEEADVPPTAG